MSLQLLELLSTFPARRVLVVGDLILDHYVTGSVTRTSPEAPVPIMKVEADRWLPGGAANVARNLAALGAEVRLIGLAGRDDAGRQLARLLRADKKIHSVLIADGSRPTTIKTRCVAQGQQMLRLDREDASPAGEQARRAILDHLNLSEVDGVILSDYGKGVLHPSLIREIILRAGRAGREVIVDPKGQNYDRYRGATILTPNLKEAAEATGMAIDNEETLLAAARELQRQIKGQAVCITRGAKGVSIFPKRGRATHLPARAREVYDVTGAGDTFIALMALARFSGASFPAAAELGNIAAGLKVAIAGVATVPPESIRREILGDHTGKHRTQRELATICKELRQAGRRVVFTNGCFDLLHSGHIRLLEEARRLGDVLIVALNSDAGVRRLKGKPRPILNSDERTKLLAALATVDYVTVFEADTPRELLRALQPNILVKGVTPDGDVVGRDIVEAYGGQVRTLRVESHTSVDALVERLGGK